MDTIELVMALVFLGSMINIVVAFYLWARSESKSEGNTTWKGYL